MTVLQVTNLKKLYDHRVIWDGVSFHLAAGERRLGVVGARMADGRVKRDEAEMARLTEEFVALQREATEIKRELGIG